MPPIDSPYFQYEPRKGLISACIVTRNASELLQRYLHSLANSLGDRMEMEIIVADNDSTDDTETMLKTDFPQARRLFFQPGIGFSKGINRAIAESRGEYLLIATPSTEILEDAIPVLLDHLERFADIGVVGPKIIHPDGTTQYSSKKMPVPNVAMLHTLYLFGLIHPNKILNEYFLFNYDSDEPLEVESLTMSLMLARRSVFEQAGVLDEGLFAWASDVDWCYQVENTNWKQVFVPRAIAVHRRSSVSRKQPLVNLTHYHRDLMFFYRKHYASRNSVLANIFWQVMLQARFLMQAIRFLVKRNNDFSFY